MSDREGKRKRWKTPSALDLELWSAVTRDVTPFRARPVVPQPAATPQAEHRPTGSPPLRREPPPQVRGAPALVDLDHTTRKKLKRGRLDVDAKLDLHGMRQADAHAALNGFLRRAQADGARIAIVVTGKGLTQDGGGVLRRMAPHWLQSPALRDVVAGFGEAARQHGGEGALYVRLRRPGGLAAR
jgi:DNA-nicking Smr family endonuclease